jgi:hypothetical protein
MKVNVTYHPHEANLIEELCKFEGIEISFCYLDSALYKKYYKGHKPAIIIDDECAVLYGFWQFAEYLMKNGYIRC